jgi:hypothetical protein
MAKVRYRPVIAGVEWREPIDIRLFLQVLLDETDPRLAAERQSTDATRTTDEPDGPRQPNRPPSQPRSRARRISFLTLVRPMP